VRGPSMGEKATTILLRSEHQPRRQSRPLLGNRWNGQGGARDPICLAHEGSTTAGL
jgi:hypothetical protein